MYGTLCPDDGERRCYLKFSTNKSVKEGPGTVFVYCPYGSKSRAKRQLLKSRAFASKTDVGSVHVPRTGSELGKVPSNAIVDVRVLNEAGYYAGRKSDGRLEAITFRDIEAKYAIGKCLYDKLSARGGRFLVTSFYPMGDNYRWLAKYDGLDYSDVTLVVTESAKDLPSLLGVDGAVMSKGELKCLHMYLSMNYYSDSRFAVVPHKPMYPGATFHGDIDLSIYTGVARRLEEPALSIMDTMGIDVRRLKRSGFKGPRSVLLNPYGNSIELRSEAEKQNTKDVMDGLSRLFLERGYDVYTNTPFPSQEEIPGTKRFEGDIVSLVNGASGFDLIVTVFTGFMEVVMYTDCNLVVLTYSNANSRSNMAEGLGRNNYWEFNVLKSDPGELVSEISRTFDGILMEKGFSYPGPAERVITLKEKAALFKGQDVTPSLMRVMSQTMGKTDLRDLIGAGTRDPLLCCVMAKSLEAGKTVPMDIPKAIIMYRRASKMGVKWAVRKVKELKKQL
ncbi:MAG: hypothetical protein IKQ60_04695 [Candidatus Methanomethylophilaceae archaeon]|nr:hypothetical protein [Candidatus Methanomethylophilaceae archaeon]